MKKILLILLLICGLPVHAQYFGGKPISGTQLDHAHPLAQDLVGCWLAGHGGNKAFDLSGNGNHATFQADTHLVIGPFGYAWDFDGVGDYIDLGNVPQLQGASEFAISVWAIYDGTEKRFMGKGGASRDLQVSWWSNTLYFDVADETDRATCTLGSGEWYHIVFLLTGGNSFIYVNGVQEGTVAEPDSITSNSNSFLLGDNGEGTHNFDGRVDHLYFYNRGITPSEIRDLYVDPFCMFVRDDTLIASAAAPSGGQVIMIQLSKIFPYTVPFMIIVLATLLFGRGTWPKKH